MFTELLQQQFPRILSQACRDESSPFYGCFDRNWWHYRIRDFASIMLQQGGYTTFLLSEMEEYASYKDKFTSLAHASAIFWNKRAKRKGAFEEYYPWEQGYPPLAFSTLAMTKLVLEGIVRKEELSTGLRKAARQLQKRFEYQAGNQQVAGLAALVCIRKIAPELVDEKSYKELKKKTLSLQFSEGWYTEYDGPDLGYLSVTLDCLWDAYDVSGDNDFLISARAALNYLYTFICRKKSGAGMFNSRNTDYLVPYGICRFLECEDFKTKASFILGSLYGNIQAPDHFFYAIDDRYWSHYIGHSVVRAELFLRESELKAEARNVVVKEYDLHLKQSGYLFRKNNNTELLLASLKGGIFSLTTEKGWAMDYGWIVRQRKHQFVNHWWSQDWKVGVSEKNISIKGQLFPHSEKTSKPFLHFGLRAMSFVFGSSLTHLLRKVLIFKKGSSGISFERHIEIEEQNLIVKDHIKGLTSTADIKRAQRASKRHVASADSYHKEDNILSDQIHISERMERNRDEILIETTYKL